MKNFLYLIFTLFLISCEPKLQPNNNSIPAENTSIEVELEVPQIPVGNIINPLLTQDTLSHQKAYRKMIAGIKRDKNRLSAALQRDQIDMDSVGRYFTRIMRDSVFHYWYGTPWDFNGYTNEPRNGIIACGYFVSTPLKHIGLNVNRYRLAQQAAEPIVKTVSAGQDIFRTSDYIIFKNYLNMMPKNGLYAIGLSNHVGFILRDDGENSMVHSDYVNPVAVCKKTIDSCEALGYSEIYVLGELSHNPTFLQRWLDGSPITIIEE